MDFEEKPLSWQCSTALVLEKEIEGTFGGEVSLWTTMYDFIIWGGLSYVKVCRVILLLGFPVTSTYFAVWDAFIVYESFGRGLRYTAETKYT